MKIHPTTHRYWYIKSTNLIWYCVSVSSWLWVFGGKQVDLYRDKLALRPCFLREAARQKKKNRLILWGGFSLTHPRPSWADWKLEPHLGVNGRMWALLTKPKRSGWSDQKQQGRRLKEQVTVPAPTLKQVKSTVRTQQGETFTYRICNCVIMDPTGCLARPTLLCPYRKNTWICTNTCSHVHLILHMGNLKTVEEMWNMQNACFEYGTCVVWKVLKM